MYLSPLAEPDQKNGEMEDPYGRMLGEHIFLQKNEVKVLYQAEDFSIIRPWENDLVYRAHDGRNLTPRFKVFHWLCASTEELGLELLPSPMNRFELKNLTMLPDFDRDVLSDFFQVSALGLNTNVNYEHNDPLKFSLVAWQQKIRYARDNYVSVTFRAIDFFTGIKLRVSIVAERDYKHDVSFLPKLYFVSYAEEYINYDDPVVVSRMDAVKITPLTKGAYFYPTDLKKADGTTIANAYGVDDPVAVSLGGYDCQRLLDFEYLCKDKAGKEQKRKMKMIFIPAEKFEIETGTYNHRTDGKIDPPPYTPGTTVKIPHIGPR